MSLHISSLFQSTYSTLRAYAFNHKAAPHPERASGLGSSLEIRHETGNQVASARRANGPWRQPTLAAQIPLKTEPLASCYSPHATGQAVAEERSDIAKTLQHMYTSGPSRTVENIAPSPNKQWLAAHFGRKIELWSIDSPETETPKLLRVFSGNFENVTSVALSPDSKWLTAGKADGSAQMWSTQTAAPTFKTFSYVPTHRQALNGSSTTNHVAFSPDGKWLLGCNGNVSIWSTTADKPARSCLPLNDPAHAIAFMPNGRLAVRSEDCSVRIYRFTETDELEPLGELENHSQEVKSVAFLQDDEWLTSGSQGDTVKLWAREANADISNL